MALSSDAGGLRGKRTAIRAIKLVAILLVIGPFLVHAVPQVVGASHSYVVLSDSMAPTINAGDVVVVESVEPTAIRKGDVITFQEGTASAVPTTHRVVEVIRSEGAIAFRTKGDANEDPDQTSVVASQVLGEVIFVIPYLGYVVQFANTTYGFIALVIAPLSLLIITEVWRAVRSTRLSGPSTDEFPISESTGGVQPPSQAGSGNQEAAGSPAERVDEPEASDGYTVTVTDLRLTAVVLGVFAAYSGWLVYTNLSMWSVMVSVAATGGFLLVGGLVLFAENSRANEQDSNEAHWNGRETESDFRIVTSPPSSISEIHTASSETVGSLEVLMERAIAEGHPVVRDPNGPEYYLVSNDLALRYPVGELLGSATNDPTSSRETNVIGDPENLDSDDRPYGGDVARDDP